MNPYLSEIRLMSFAFAPRGWALCNGQLMSVTQNQALFSLLGTTYGGDGRATFGLPNLQGSVPMHTGEQPYTMGAIGGEAAHTLGPNEMASHNHLLMAKAGSADADAAGVLPGPTVVLAQALAAQPKSGGQPVPPVPVSNFGTGTPNLTMAAGAIGANAGGQPHPNQQPYLVLSFCIALQGVYPSRG